MTEPERRHDDKAVARLEVGFDNLKEQFGEVKASVKNVDSKLDALLDMTITLAKLSDKQMGLEIADKDLKDSLATISKDFSEFKQKEFEPVKEFKTKWETGLRIWIFVFFLAQGTIGWYIKDKIDELGKMLVKVEQLSQRVETLEAKVK